MSNIQEEAKVEDSRMSFVTVSSMISEFPNDKQDNKNNKEMKKSENKRNNEMSCDLKENFVEMPLQYSSLDKIKNKEIIPFLTVEDKGEKKD